MSRNEREEGMEHGMKAERSHGMKANRAGGEAGNSSPDSIRRGGGEDPRRYEARIIMETKVRDHDQSGYNHNGVQAPEAALGNNEHMAKMQARAMGMGSPEPDGTYRR